MIASGTLFPSAQARSAAARQPPVMRCIRLTVVGLAWEIVSAACERAARCAASVSFRHSHAASAIPAAAAVKGPQLWVTMSVMACATSVWVRQDTNSTRCG